MVYNKVNNRVNVLYLTALAIGHRAPSVLNCLTLFLLCDVADLVNNICALNVIDILADLLISGLTGGGT